MTRLLLILLLADLLPWQWWRRLWFDLLIKNAIAFLIEFPVPETKEEPREISN